MKNRKLRTLSQAAFIGILTIIAVFTTACDKGGSTQSQTGTIAERPQTQTEAQEQTQTTITNAGPFQQILNGDLSDFAGMWVNGNGNSITLTSKGLFYHGYNAYNFRKDGSSYSWDVSMDGDSIPARLFPAGVELVNGNNKIIQTDTTRPRINIYFVESNADVFYRAGDQTEAGVPANVVEIINKRIAAAENCDIAAFRSTLPHWEDYYDYSTQLSMLFDFFGDLFYIDADVFYYAISEGTEDLTEIAEKLLRGTYAPKSRKTGLRVTKIEDAPDSWAYRATITNNRNESFDYDFRYVSF